MAPDLWWQLLVPTYLLPVPKVLKNIGQVILCSGWKETPAIFATPVFGICHTFCTMFATPWYNCTVLVILCWCDCLSFIFHICHPRSWRVLQFLSLSVLHLSPYVLYLSPCVYCICSPVSIVFVPLCVGAIIGYWLIEADIVLRWSVRSNNAITKQILSESENSNELA